MAGKIVTHYAVFHNLGSNTTIGVYYDGGGADYIRNLSIEQASFMIDLLRNEKPIAYDSNTKRLSTFQKEPVGENE